MSRPGLPSHTFVQRSPWLLKKAVRDHSALVERTAVVAPPPIYGSRMSRPASHPHLRDHKARDHHRARTYEAMLWVVLMLAVVGCMDALIAALSPPFFVLAVLDESAHLATAGLVLVLVRRTSWGLVVAALIATVAIDIDHLPAELGSRFLTMGTPRPYGHSLVGIGAILLAALVVIRRRDVVAGLAFGLIVHLGRDLATGSGVSLLWPFDDEVFRVAYPIYLGSVGLVALLGLVRLGSTLRNDRPRRRRLRRSAPREGRA
jgi:inner membrane protein